MPGRGRAIPCAWTPTARWQASQAWSGPWAWQPQDIVNAVTESGLRGRGGAAFPAGIKWQTVLDTPGEQKYIVCNADEGDSGTFADRLLMEADPYQLIEGMIIAGLAVGATRGYIYLRSEYPRARDILEQAIAWPGRNSYLGDNIRGSGQGFRAGVAHRRRRLYLRRGDLPAGQPRGQARDGARQAAPAGDRGPVRPAHGGQQCADPGGGHHGAGRRARSSTGTSACGRSRGTLAVQLAGNIRRGGLVELAYGATLRQLVEEYGGGTYSGRPARAIQVGGPLGAYLPESQWDTPLDYEAFAGDRRNARPRRRGGVRRYRRHGAAGALCDGVLRGGVLRQVHALPDRFGARGGSDRPDYRAGGNRASNAALLRDLCDTMEAGSLCAMGGLTPLSRCAVRWTIFPRTFPGRQRGLVLRRRGVRLPARRLVQCCSFTNRNRIRYTGRSRRGTHVSLSIDGQQVTVPAGTSVMRAAAEAGIKVPRLCATDSLEAFGSCRVCLVEDRGCEGLPGLLHHAGAGGYGGAHPDRQARGAAPQCHGAVHLRSPAGLPDLSHQRRL